MIHKTIKINHIHYSIIIISILFALLTLIVDSSIIGSADFGNITNIPTQTNPLLNSSSGFNQSNDNLTCYNQSTQDLDNDEVKNIFNWYKNGDSTMILNMPFEGGSNSTFTKDYALGNNGSVNGLIWNISDGFDGRGAYEFDGINNHLEIVDVSNFVELESGSISLWINLDEIPGGNTRVFGISNGGVTSSARISLFIQGGTSQFRYEVYNNAGAQIIETNNGAETDISTGEWHHIVITNQESVGNNIYLDGSQISLSYLGGDSNSDDFLNSLGVEIDSVRFGTLYYQGSNIQNFKGSLDEIKIYNISLTSQQISALYNNRPDLIVSQETNLNDTWQCEITPNDGVQDGATLSSNNLTIREILTSNSITNLNNQSQSETWIFWNWTNPSSLGYLENIIHIDGNNIANTSNNYYNATGLTANSSYTITVHTKNINNEINNTDVNSSATTLNACTENWSVNFTTCNVSDQRIKFYIDTNSCGTIYDIPGDNGSVEACDYCTPNLTNTSWTIWLNISCLTNDTINQTRNLTQYDLNYCEEVSNQTFIEFRNTESCDYCQYNIINTSWSPWTNQTDCLPSNQYTQERSRIEYDTNHQSCYMITSLETDLWNNGTNNTHQESQILGCTYPIQAPSGGGSGGNSKKYDCYDGKDNDNDSLIDWPSDPGCFGKYDDNEFNKIEIIIKNVSLGCSEDWICFEWGQCSNNEQTRSCYDSNYCKSETLKPEILRGCSNIKTKNISYKKVVPLKRTNEEKEEKTQLNNIITGFSIYDIKPSFDLFAWLMLLLIFMTILGITFTNIVEREKIIFENQELIEKNKLEENKINKNIKISSEKELILNDHIKSLNKEIEVLENYLKK